MPTEEEIVLTKRARRSKNRGRAYETQVIKRLKDLGYDPKRKLLSGAYLARPYDIAVAPYRLKIECKRTLKEYITIHKKWLDRIKEKLVFVFSVGSFKGRQRIAMWTIFETPPSTEPSCVNGDGGRHVIQVKKSKKVDGKEIDSGMFFKCEDKYFSVATLEEYMKRYPPTKERLNESGPTV